MIVISGALVLVALVLLVIGVVDPSLPFVYASIAVSLVSLVFLVIGILQRRGEPVPDGAAAAPTPADTAVETPADVTAVIPAQSRGTQEAPVAASADEEPAAAGGEVLVVAGRPRYHVEGCRYLTGKDAQAVDVLDAREEGFTPCGVCKPDDALAAVVDEPVEDEVVEQDAVEDEPVAVDEDVPGAEELPEPAPAPSRRTAAKKATSTRATTGRAPARKAATKAVPAEPAPAAEVALAAGAAKAQAAKKAPAKKAPARKASPAAAAAAESAPAAARGAGKVVVIPERGRFHKADCRYVRGVDGAEVLTKAAATKQGYDACGVCKP